MNSFKVHVFFNSNTHGMAHVKVCPRVIYVVYVVYLKIRNDYWNYTIRPQQNFSKHCCFVFR